MFLDCSRRTLIIYMQTIENSELVAQHSSCFAAAAAVYTNLK